MEIGGINMALIVCPECGKEISDKAEACIHCGYPMKKIKEEKVCSEEFKEPISICKQCYKKISTQDTICQHCGSKIEKKWFDDKNICKINGIKYDLTPFMSDILNKDEPIEILKRGINGMQDLTGCADCSKLCFSLREGKALPKEFNGKTSAEISREVEQWEKSQVHCPRCGSTSVEEMVYAPLPYIRREYLYCNNCHFEFEKH